METKYHMSREWRFITIVENESQLEEMRLTRKVYSVCKTFNGDKLKYRCTAFRRTDCKYLMCSIRDDGGKYEIYEKGEHNHLLGLPSKARQSFGTHRAATALLKKSMKRSKMLNMKKMFVGEDVQEQRFSAPIRFKRAKKNLSIGQLFHMGPGWTFFGTVDTPEEIEKVRHEHRVSILSKTFGGEKMKFRCSTYARSKCCYMLCVLHTNQGNYELYKYGQHTHPNRTPNSNFGSKNPARAKIFADTQSPFNKASSSCSNLGTPKFDVKKELASSMDSDTPKTQTHKKWKHFASFNTLEQLDALCKSKGLLEHQSEELKTSNVIRTRYRCNTWQTTNCTYQMYSITDANSPLSTFELFEVVPNMHNHEQLDLSTAPTDNSLRRSSQLYNSSARDGSDQDEKMLARQLLQHYSIDQKLISGSSRSDFSEELNNSRQSMKTTSTKEFLRQSSSASSSFNLTEKKSELGIVAKKLSLDISSDGDMYMFFSKDPSMAGHWLELEEKADTVLVSEFHQCKPVGEKCWQKADWDQFICAVRGKCVDYFFGDTDGCGINQEAEY